MLQALGFSMLDEAGEQIGFGAGELMRIARVSSAGAMPELAECTFRVACDVTNPLCGPEGASAVYGPQKGASADMIRNMDAGLARFAAAAGEVFPSADASHPGTGAAGGLGFAFQAFLNGALEPGVKIIIEETGLAEYLKNADYVVTGETHLPPYRVLERDGVKIVVLGMITPAIPAWLSENLWQGLRFDDMEETARKWMKVIREKENPDLVIGLFHAGQDAFVMSGRYNENASLNVAKNVPGFDMVLLQNISLMLKGLTDRTLKHVNL